MSVSMQNEGSVISHEKGVVRTPVVTLAVCRNNLSSSLAMQEAIISLILSLESLGLCWGDADENVRERLS